MPTAAFPRSLAFHIRGSTQTALQPAVQTALKTAVELGSTSRPSSLMSRWPHMFAIGAWDAWNVAGTEAGPLLELYMR